MPQVTALFGRKGRTALAQLSLESPGDWLLRQQLTMLDALRAQIRELELRIAADGEADAAARLPSMTTGVGPILGNGLGGGD